jgi:hypothetical protein
MSNNRHFVSTLLVNRVSASINMSSISWGVGACPRSTYRSCSIHAHGFESKRFCIAERQTLFGCCWNRLEVNAIFATLLLSRDQGEFRRRVNFCQSAHPRGSSEYIELESLNSYNPYNPHLSPLFSPHGPERSGRL